MANESYKDKRNTIGRLNLDRSGLRILLLPMVAGFHLGISLIKPKSVVRTSYFRGLDCMLLNISILETRISNGGH